MDIAAANTAQVIIALASVISMVSIIVGMIVFFSKISAEVKTANEHLGKLYDTKGKANFVYDSDCIKNREAISAQITAGFDDMKLTFKEFERVNSQARQKIFTQIESFHFKSGEAKTRLEILERDLKEIKEKKGSI